MFYDTHAERKIRIVPEQQKAQVSADGKRVELCQYDVAVLLFEKG